MTFLYNQYRKSTSRWVVLAAFSNFVSSIDE